MQDRHTAPLDEKLELIAELDERIAMSKAAERRALMRGALIATAMFGFMGALSHTVAPAVFEVIRYGGSALLLSSEFLVRRLGRRRLENMQEALLARSSVEQAR